jgi:hypothetical protein
MKINMPLTVPAPVLDLAQNILSANNPNYKQSLIIRMEDIKKFCEEVLAEANKRK